MANTTSEIVRTRTLENGKKLNYSTTNPGLVKDALEAQEKDCSYGKMKAKECFAGLNSVENKLQYIDRSKFMTVRQRLQQRDNNNNP